MKRRPPHRLEPDSELYIYYLEGRLPPQAAFPSDTFIGNWEEDGFSFLFFSRPSDHTVEALLNAQPQLTLLDRFHMTYDQWHGGKIVPFISGGFIISPPWQKQDSPSPVRPMNSPSPE